jgi:hypothetical protein
VLFLSLLAGRWFDFLFACLFASAVVYDVGRTSIIVKPSILGRSRCGVLFLSPLTGRWFAFLFACLFASPVFYDVGRTSIIVKPSILPCGTVKVWRALSEPAQWKVVCFSVCLLVCVSSFLRCWPHINNCKTIDFALPRE